MKGHTSLRDVAIIGAGPVGCVTALAFADRGADVLLLEAQPTSPTRLAGEWLHPAAVEVLAIHRVDLKTAPGLPGRGFAVFPDDGSAPILLPYTEGRQGLTCEHPVLVSTLRRYATDHPRIQTVNGARVTSVSGQVVRYATATASETVVRAGAIVGADGRASAARKFLGLADARAPISSMAGITLDDADLPFESFGHVVLGGPGPVLLYRIGPRAVRACLDVPLPIPRNADGHARLWGAYAEALPETLRGAFRSALSRRPITWAANQFRPRAHYGIPGLALVGDAVGHFHPLTAVGLTLGFQDAEALAKAASFSEYEQERATRSLVAELLATALFQAFTFRDSGTLALRRAIYRLWREDPAERGRTIEFLSAQETDLAQFRRAFLKVMTLALEGIVAQAAATRRLGDVARVLRGLGGWLEWLPAGMLPRPLTATLRLGTPSPRPMPMRSGSLQPGELPARRAPYRATAQVGK